MSDFETAKDKVLMGSERKSMIISDQEKENTAYHEAGHTLVAKKLPGADPIHKVTIVPRGTALGLTQQLPTDDRYTQNRGYCEEQMVFLGKDLAHHQDYSEETAKQIDAEIHDIVVRNYERAKKIVQENMGILKWMSEALLEYETLDANQIDQIMEGKKLKPLAKKKTVEATTPEEESKKKNKVPPMPEPTKA